MKITKKELGEIAENFLNVLVREDIKSEEDLEKRVEERFLFSEKSKDFVSMELRPSNFGTMAYTISYIRPGTGIPIELKLNPKLKYSQIILKAEERLEGYDPFTIDPFNNLIQNRVFDYSFLRLKKELERLSELE